MSNQRIAQAIVDAGVTPRESDRNGEPANIVDGLFAIARSIDRLAGAIEASGDGVVNVRVAAGKGVAEHVARAVHDEMRRIP